MAQIIEGQRDPKKVAAEKRQAAVKAALNRHKAKSFSQLPQPAKDELLLALLQAAGLADENGVIR